MQEALKKTTSDAAEPLEKGVTLCIQSEYIKLSGSWSWNLQTDAVYCSDVMSFPEDFAGTKALIHPDDLANLKAALGLMEEREISHLDFRIITTYGEVKTLSGQKVSLDQVGGHVDPVPGREPWEEFLQDIAAQRKTDFLELRKELTDFTERTHGIGSWIINKNTAQAWYSDNVFRIYGLAPQSLNAHPNTFNQFIHPDDRVVVRDMFEKAYEEELPLHIEYRIFLTDGQIRFVQHITKWLFNNKGQLLFCGVLRDVTEERSIIDELLAAQSETLLHRQILRISEQQVSTAYWYTHLGTRRTSYSENYSRIYGVKPDVFPSNNSLLNLVHPNDREKVRAAIDKMYREHDLPETEFRIIRPNGKIRNLKQSGRLLIARGNDMVMIGVVQDITTLKTLEQKIAELNETIMLNRMVLELTEAGSEISYIIWLPDGQMRWSDGLYHLIGQKPGATEPQSRIFHKSIHPADLKIFKEKEALVISGQSADDIFVRLVTKSGIRRLHFSFRHFSYDNDLSTGLNVGVGIIHDITRQTATDEQLAENKLFTEFLSNSVNEMIIFSNTDNIVLHWNDVAEEKTGVKKEDALSHNLFDVLPQLDEENFLGQFHSALSGEETSLTYKLNGYMQQAHNYWLYPLKNQNQEVSGVLHIVHDVSEHLRLQQQLGERLNFIESLLESSVDRIVVMDRFMNYLYWNRKAEEYYGIQKEKVIGKNILEIFPSFRNNLGYQEFRRVLRGETVFLPAVEDEKTEEYSETYLTPIKNEAGEVTAVLWIVHDLMRELAIQKEKRRAEEELKKQAHYIQRITETVPDMISVTDLATGKFDYLNKEVFKQHGFDPTELDIKGNTKRMEYVHPEDRDTISSYFEKFRQAHDQEIITAEYRARDIMGEWKCFLVRGRVFQRNEAGEVSHVLNVIENITERKKAEQEVKETKDLLQTAIQASVTSFDVCRAIRDENNAVIDFEFILSNNKFQPEGVDLTGKRYTEMFPGIKQSGVFEKFVQATEDGVPQDFEVHYTHENYDNWFRIVAVKLGDGFLNTGEDITSRKKAEQEILRLKDEIAQKATDQYQKLYNAIDEGFCLLELIYDVNGKAVDMRILDFNQAFEKQTGIKAEAGKTFRDYISEHDVDRYERFADVVRTGKSVRFTDYSISLGRWFEFHGARVGSASDNRLALVFLDITERKNAEMALRESEERLSTLLKTYAQAIWETNAEGEIVVDSHSWRAYTGQTIEELKGSGWTNVIHPDDRRHIQEMWRHSVNSKISLNSEFRIRHVTGEYRWTNILATPLLDENGNLIKWIGMNIDIQLRKEAEQKLKELAEEEVREHRDMLAQTAIASPDAITIYDLEQKHPVYLNDCLAQWTGHTTDELIRLGYEGRLQLIHANDREKLLAFNQSMLSAKDGDIKKVEYRLHTHNGLYWIRNRSKVFKRNEKGEPTHLLSVLQDFTEEMNLREKLSDRTKYAEAIIDSSIDRMYVFDKSYRVTAWNKRSEITTGKTREMVIGKNIYDEFPKLKEDKTIRQAMDQAINGQYTYVPAKKGIYVNAWYERFYIPLQNDEQETYGVLVIMHDVTDVVTKEEELRKLNNTLGQKNAELEQKNEEITQFSFVASHDLQEPLRKIHTFANWILEQESDRLSPMVKNFTTKIKTAVRRMELLTEDILVLTKINSDQHRNDVVNLEEVLGLVKQDMSNEIRYADAQIEAGPLPVIKGNSNQLFYLFKNIVSNGIKFQRPGNVPHIKITAEIIEATSLPVPYPQEEYLKLSFSDNGFGFDNEFAKKIFQVFQRLHGSNEFQGTGIGLSICKRIMENHEGWIEVESEKGKGSTFYCFFPLI